MKPISSLSYIWLFDVDGTLTAPRGQIEALFEERLLRFVSTHDVRIVTGGDNARILHQLGPVLTGSLHTRYNCLGNSIWRQNAEVARQDFAVPLGLESFLLEMLTSFEYPLARPPHFVKQNGMLAFSLLGTEASVMERQTYERWDRRTGARQALASQVCEVYPQLTAQVAGQTSVDIFPKGRDKSQILPYLDRPVRFFADSTQPGGNDHALATALLERSDGSRVYPVRDWQDTMNLLTQYSADF